MAGARPGGSVRLRTILSSRTRAAPRKGTRSRPEIGAVVACWTRVITDLLTTQTVPLRASIESTKCRAEFHLLPPATGLTLGVSGHPLPLDKYNPDSLHGCRPAGELRSSRNSHGHGPGCIRAVARFLRFDREDPIWPNRDRFILSAGHASTLLYSLLHLAGVKAVNRKYETMGELAVPLDDLKNFRQLESKCPGHPEYRWTSGVETTTGPLGQGVATSVGIALGSKWLAERYNRPNFPMFDYDVYALAGDGCMMEGISSEAASLAGHLRLSNLCWIYDNNHITIEGNTSLAFSEDVAGRFLAS